MATAAPTRPRSRRDRIGAPALRVLQVFGSLHAALIFGQPVFAGMYLHGDYDMLGLHAAGADAVTYVAYTQILIAALVWWSARRWWPLAASVALAIGETVQYVAGMAGALDLHIPLGVALVTGATILTVALWLARPVVHEEVSS